MKVMINTLLDIIKMSEERFAEKIIQLKLFKRSRGLSRNIDKAISLINERMVFLIKTSESQEDKHKNEFILKCLIFSEIFTKLEITKLLFLLKKEDIEPDKIAYLDEMTNIII